MRKTPKHKALRKTSVSVCLNKVKGKPATKVQHTFAPDFSSHKTLNTPYILLTCLILAEVPKGSHRTPSTTLEPRHSPVERSRCLAAWIFLYRTAAPCITYQHFKALPISHHPDLLEQLYSRQNSKGTAPYASRLDGWNRRYPRSAACGHPSIPVTCLVFQATKPKGGRRFRRMPRVEICGNAAFINLLLPSTLLLLEDPHLKNVAAAPSPKGGMLRYQTRVRGRSLCRALH